MASKDKDVVDDEEAPVKASGNKKGAIVKWLGISLAIVALVGGSVGVSIYLMKSMLLDQGTAQEGEQSSGHKAKENKGKPKQPKVAIYYKLEPPFVANFQGQSGTKFLQLTIELLTYDQETITAIEQNMPIIKNNIVFLLSGANYDQVSTIEGKQKLRADTLAEIQKILKEKTGKPGVEEVYFTSIVMQ